MTSALPTNQHISIMDLQDARLYSRNWGCISGGEKKETRQALPLGSLHSSWREVTDNKQTSKCLMSSMLETD